MSRRIWVRTIHGMLQDARGMCTDERPHTEIDALLARIVERAKDLETELQVCKEGR